jgi:hypothetical protein
MRFDSEYIHASTKIERLGILSSLEQKSMEINRKMESISIRENLAMSYPDIKNTFDEILTLRNSMIDKPLILEWNTWRLFNLVPDSESIVGNFLSDADGNPLRTASGGIADIVCEFREFWLVIEVTLQSGMKQYETEGEPITRHVGNHIRKLREIGDVRPVYGLFVAEKINKELLFYLNAISWRESQHYGGKIQIYPIEISKLINIFDEVNFEDFTSNKILSSFSLIFSETLQSLGEIDWQTRGHEILIQEFSKGGD